MSDLLTLAADDYHAGPDDQPRLSASIAHILCTQSPLHAWTAHPRLNSNYERKEEERFDVGKAAHSVLLEGEDNIYVVHEDSWRKNVAKEARDYARSLGKVPLLAANRDEVMAMVDAVREQLAAHEAEPPLFSDGKPETSVLWEEGGVLCKARLDWLRNDRLAIDDLKTTSRSASPAAFSRNLFSTGADIQAALYLRAIRHVLNGEREIWGDPLPRPQFRWAVIETAPPYALSVISPGQDVLALGAAKVDWALEQWRSCLAANSWPAYPAKVAFAELPAYEETRWLERESVAA